jgi:hypothetical protein
MAPPPKKGTPQNRKPQRGQEVVQVFEPAELVRLYDESVALAWWQRDALPDASQVLAREPFTWTAEVTPSGEELAPLEPLVESAAVLERVKELIDLHAALFEAELVGVRVALTQKPLCPSFHLNKQHCRLISTLAGPGTQWVTGPLYAAHDKSVVEQLPSGAAGWFKGLAWPGVQPIPHRSPPGDARRLVLSLDLL